MKGEKMEKIKELKDLDLVDRFLFAEVMEDEGSLADVLEIILGREVVLKGLPQVEKEFRKNVWSRQVRLDVCTKDVFDNVYDTEVQKRKTHGLPQRTRFYNGVIDCKLLEPGDDYINLNDVFIIMIMPFDLFGKGLYRYTFDMSCREVPGLRLEDGATRIFLNTQGTETAGVSQELIDLLHYFEKTTDSNAAASSSDKIRRLHEKVSRIKDSEEIGIKFMNEWEEKMLERKEGREEGRAEGERAKQREIAEKMIAMGMDIPTVSEATGLSEDEVRGLKNAGR